MPLDSHDILSPRVVRGMIDNQKEIIKTLEEKLSNIPQGEGSDLKDARWEVETALENVRSHLEDLRGELRIAIEYDPHSQQTS